MAWRFKVSKYKNAAGIVPRKEDWLTDIKVGSPQSCGNLVKASAAFMAFNVENRGGGSLGVLPLSTKGRMEPSTPLLHGHSDLITDFDFSPFDDGMLATGSTDAFVHVWHIPEDGLSSNLTKPEYTLPQFDKRVENVLFHPTTEFLLTVSYYDTVKLYDILHQKEISCCRESEDQIQSTSWKTDGSQFVTTSKDKTVRIYDPRSSSVVVEAPGHPSPKDSRVVWLGSSDVILTTGYNQNRIREVMLRDIRSFNKPFKSQGFDSSTGILMPLFDPETNMLFLAGKADVSIMYWEVTEKEPFLTEGLKHNGSIQTKGACLVPKRGLDVMNGEVNRLLQLTSNALIPITYQVPRKTYREFHADLYPDTRSTLNPQPVGDWVSGGNKIPSKVSLDPSKRSGGLQVHRGPLSQREEMDGGLPPTEGTNGTHSNGNSAPVPAPRARNSSNGTESPLKESKPVTLSKPTVAVKPNLMAPKPAARSSLTQSNREKCYNQINANEGPETLAQMRASLRHNEESDDIMKSLDQESRDETDKHFDDNSKLSSLRAQFEGLGSNSDEKYNDDGANDSNRMVSSKFSSKPSEVQTPDGTVLQTVSAATPGSPVVHKRPTTTRTRSFRRICKFRHLKGTPGHRSTHMDNLRDLSRTTPGESDGIACNSQFVVLPLTGAGGRVSVMSHKKGGRLPDGVIPAFLCGASVLDFTFDPFDENKLYTACDDGKILEWEIPEGGLKRPCNEPSNVYCDGSDKVTSLKCHPMASGLMAAVGGDFIVRIWDLNTNTVANYLDPHPDQVFCVSWSPCGIYLATLCRDGNVRVYDPRKSGGPCREGPGPQGVRGGRVLWALDGNFLVTTGSSKTSERQVSVYKSSDLKAPVTTVSLDHSPAILMPNYDPDSNTLFVTAKGESTIHCYEVGADSPHLFPLSHHKASSVHQGLTFLPKHTCDVRAVEFAKSLRLTKSTLEPLSFTVPRIRTTLFQDDIFPPTAVRWIPSLEAGDWLSGVNAKPHYVSLQPNDMMSLSDARGDSPPSEGSGTPREQQTPNTPPITSFARNLPEEVKETQNKLEQSMSQQIEDSSQGPLAQDMAEGVEESEWGEEV